MGYATKLVFYIIPLILLMVVVTIFFGQSGVWEDLKGTILETKNVAPNITSFVKVIKNPGVIDSDFMFQTSPLFF